MLHIPKWKAFLILGVCLLGIWVASPNFIPSQYMATWSGWLPQQKVPLGLDLKGGVHLVLEVDIHTVISDRLASMGEEVRAALKKEKVFFSRLDVGEGALRVQLKEAQDKERALNILGHVVPELERQTSGASDAKLLRMTFKKAALEGVKKRSVAQSIEILRRRVDVSGTLEAVIMPQGDQRIVLQLPGLTEAHHVASMLGRMAKLSLRWVESDMVASPEGRVPPAGTEWLPVQEKASQAGEKPKILGYYAVAKRPVLTGDMLSDAMAGYGENNEPEVIFQFNTAGARRFRDATAENVGRILAFVLDQEVISAPVIREPIPGGRGVIHGSFTVQEASDLSVLLRSGALPAPLTVVEERTIGPDLGSDSIRAGTIATILSVLAVCALMVVVYSWFGMIVNVAVFFNIVLLLAGMTLIQATLTLPGIAGIALTIGMAVDANVLIYERMKEEIRKKNSVPGSIDAGYRRAMATIIDSNVTTLFGTALLYIFGSGPIRGFAVTLTMGIMISMFTSISLTRLLVVTWLRRKRRMTLPIGSI